MCFISLSLGASADLEKSFNRTQLPFPKMAKRVGANQFHFSAFETFSRIKMNERQPRLRKKSKLRMEINSAAKWSHYSRYWRGEIFFSMLAQQQVSDNLQNVLIISHQPTSLYRHTNLTLLTYFHEHGNKCLPPEKKNINFPCFEEWKWNIEIMDFATGESSSKCICENDKM